MALLPGYVVGALRLVVNSSFALPATHLSAVTRTVGIAPLSSLADDRALCAQSLPCARTGEFSC